MIKNLKRLIFGEDWLAKESKPFNLLIFGPASVISSILAIPLTLLSYSFIFFGKRVFNNVIRVLLFVQHAFSLAWPYYLEEYIFDSFEIKDIFVGALFALIAFYKSIEALVNETMFKYNS